LVFFVLSSRRRHARLVSDWSADVCSSDLQGLKLHLPEIVRDLPAGGQRLHQRASGYDATIVSGEIIRRFDQSTGARPGKLIRGA